MILIKFYLKDNVLNEEQLLSKVSVSSNRQ